MADQRWCGDSGNAPALSAADTAGSVPRAASWSRPDAASPPRARNAPPAPRAPQEETTRSAWSTLAAGASRATLLPRSVLRRCPSRGVPSCAARSLSRIPLSSTTTTGTSHTEQFRCAARHPAGSTVAVLADETRGRRPLGTPRETTSSNLPETPFYPSRHNAGGI